MVRHTFSQRLLKLLYQHGLTATLLLLLGIAALSLTPHGSLGEPGVTDKVLHVLAYALAVLPMSAAPTRTYFLGAPIAVIWGVLVEFLQPAAGHYTSLGNIFANSVGILLGLLLGLALHAALENSGRYR